MSERCPSCGGLGLRVVSWNENSPCLSRCACCGGTGMVLSNTQPTKTLLDEFAMAAPDRVFEEGHHGMASFASSAYQYAAAMMAERARRDEMGNVKGKEVEK